jgi:diaminopimelate decarboxylase
MSDIHSIVSRFGTPVFVYDASTIRERTADLAAFDVVRYAQKACSTLAVVKLVKSCGVMIDAVSEYEIRRALAAGYTAGKNADGVFPIVYTADIFDNGSLDLCCQENIHVNCGSVDMIDQLGSRLRQTARHSDNNEITIRINPGFGHGHSQKTNTGGDLSKHGIWYASLHEAMAHAARYNIRITGLHIHIGSGSDFEHLAQVAEAMLEAGRAVGSTVETISCGGGLPIPYRENESYIDLKEYRRLWKQVQDTLSAEYKHPVRLEIEPGRFLVAESGQLITEIRAIKKQGKNLFYLVDAGFNNLARPVMYGAFHPIHVVSANASVDSSEPTTFCNVTIGGPLCESGDIFTQDEGGIVTTQKLMSAKVGDLLVIEKTGAYGSVMGSNYNSKPMAAEVLVDGNEVKLIRKRQTFEQLIENEKF